MPLNSDSEKNTQTQAPVLIHSSVIMTDGSAQAAPQPALQTNASCAHQHCRGWSKSSGAGTAARLKTTAILALVILAFAGLAVRLIQIQIFQAEIWRKKSLAQSVETLRVPAQRAPIFDAGSLPVAFNFKRESVLADLSILNDREAAAGKLALLLKLDPNTLYKELNRDDVRVIYLVRNIETEIADKVRALKIRGIAFEDAFVRTYPQGTLASHVLGFSGMDGGQEGLEKGLDKILRGTPGYIKLNRDAAGRSIALNGDVLAECSRPPRDGSAVTLTLDARMQQSAEEQLAQIQEEFDPKSATCILMDPNTGAILALACTPSFDPNKPSSFAPDARRCRPVTDFYEPGSTFKTFFAAMSLDQNVWRRNETIFCENGAWRLPQRTLHDSHAYGNLTFDEVIIKSSNIGAAKISSRLGYPRMYEIVRDFGFGDSTYCGIPGESKGMVRAREKWTHDSLYSVAMGHEIGVTPLQLITAFSAVINGGTLYRPMLVQHVVGENGEERYAFKPQALRRVISPNTSREMRDLLARVVMPGGTGAKAFMAEYQVGGKTGTTKKIDPATHTYSSTMYIGSFCGFAPADNPRLVCLVTVDEPRKGRGYYGGTVACPAVREVLRKGLTLLNVPTRTADEQRKAALLNASAVEH